MFAFFHSLTKVVELPPLNLEKAPSRSSFDWDFEDDGSGRNSPQQPRATTSPTKYVSRSIAAYTFMIQFLQLQGHQWENKFSSWAKALPLLLETKIMELLPIAKMSNGKITFLITTISMLKLLYQVRKQIGDDGK